MWLSRPYRKLTISVRCKFSEWVPELNKSQTLTITSRFKKHPRCAIRWEIMKNYHLSCMWYIFFIYKYIKQIESGICDCIYAKLGQGSYAADVTLVFSLIFTDNKMIFFLFIITNIMPKNTWNHEVLQIVSWKSKYKLIFLDLIQLNDWFLHAIGTGCWKSHCLYITRGFISLWNEEHR